MKHVVSISGGASSAICADRVIKKYGKENVILWFADTAWEDKDLYRFLDDLENHWRKRITTYKDGRNPLEVGEDDNFILNSRVRTCSRLLKQRPFRKFIKRLKKPVTIYLGLDWSEEHRMEAPKKNYENMNDVKVDFPLIWKPLPKQKYSEIIQEWGIKIPRLYEMGFPHNNCGGRCVAQGQKEWKRLQLYFPERFKEVEDWEEKMRNKLGKTKDRSILKNTTLKELAKKGENQMPMFTAEDSYSCFCDY